MFCFIEYNDFCCFCFDGVLQVIYSGSQIPLTKGVNAIHLPDTLSYLKRLGSCITCMQDIRISNSTVDTGICDP